MAQRAPGRWAAAGAGGAAEQNTGTRGFEATCQPTNTRPAPTSGPTTSRTCGAGRGQPDNAWSGRPHRSATRLTPPPNVDQPVSALERRTPRYPETSASAELGAERAPGALPRNVGQCRGRNRTVARCATPKRRPAPSSTRSGRPVRYPETSASAELDSERSLGALPRNVGKCRARLGAAARCTTPKCRPAPSSTRSGRSLHYPEMSASPELGTGRPVRDPETSASAELDSGRSLGAPPETSASAEVGTERSCVERQ